MDMVEGWQVFTPHGCFLLGTGTGAGLGVGTFLEKS